LVTDAQVKLYRKKRMEGKNQETAAAIAGIGTRTGQLLRPLPGKPEECRRSPRRMKRIARINHA
jgi:hypothetical protein